MGFFSFFFFFFFEKTVSLFLLCILFSFTAHFHHMIEKVVQGQQEVGEAFKQSCEFMQLNFPFHIVKLYVVPPVFMIETNKNLLKEIRCCSRVD